MTARKKIKFNLYNVTDGEKKAKVSYSLDNRADGRKCVTIYAESYSSDLAAIFDGEGYVNKSDPMTDYFERGRVVFTEDSPRYAEVRSAVEAILDRLEVKSLMRRGGMSEEEAKAEAAEKRSKREAEQEAYAERAKVRMAEEAKAKAAREAKVERIRSGETFDAATVEVNGYPITVGTRVHYTGDMANLGGDGLVVAVHPNSSYGHTFEIVMDDGRHMPLVMPFSFEARPGRRFKTMAEHDPNRVNPRKAVKVLPFTPPKVVPTLEPDGTVGERPYSGSEMERLQKAHASLALAPEAPPLPLPEPLPGPYFVTVDFPVVNKQCSLEDNDRSCQDWGVRRERVKVTEVMDLDQSEFDEFASSFLSDRPEHFGEERGGSRSDEDFEADSYRTMSPAERERYRRTCYTVGVLVTAPARPQLVVNCEGYPYARYVGRVIAELARRVAV